jgi:hypothetical protein
LLRVPDRPIIFRNKSIGGKVIKFQLINGQKKDLDNKNLKDIQIKLYKKLTRPVLSYWSEVWNVTVCNRGRIEAAEILSEINTRTCTPTPK